MKRIFVISTFTIVASILFPQNEAVLLKDVDWCHSPYCKVKPNHTICKWGLTCKPDKRCQTNVGFNKEMKDYIMELHNEKRNKIAMGEEPRVPERIRKASDMKVMQWDIHLEFVARCHSRQCQSGHDDCRTVPRFAEVGQNIYSVVFKEDIAAEIEAKEIIERAVKEWYNDIDNINEEVYSRWDVTRKPSDRFTQMVWAKTSHMGCGLSQQQKQGAVKFFVVCNYGTEGNKPGEPIYTPGEPCSKCPPSKPCNFKYAGLCGGILEYPLKCPCEEIQQTGE